ncbi:hypothetical protein H0H92_012741 [Tricholoma furcatifolium]|nr:hypothetical protein H0H92_012741 [Tricholoma furcatifolium]
MPAILNLKFKGNKSFVAFSNLGDAESLTKTWKACLVCTKVASYLEQGSRLENLSWRLWHLQNLMVDSDNAKSKREFKKLSKSMGDKLDKEKGRSIEELEAPNYKANHSTDLIRQRAEEKERNRAMPGTIKRMQFTFNLDTPSPAVNEPVTKPNLKPSTEFNNRSWNAPRANEEAMDIAQDEGNDKDPPSTSRRFSGALRFPSLFNNDFAPSALLSATPTVTNSMNYGEGLNPTPSHDSFGISRPTIELPLDELLDSTTSESYDLWSLTYPQQDIVMTSVPTPVQPAPVTAKKLPPPAQESEDESSPESDDEDSDFDLTALSQAKAKKTRKRIPAASQVAKEALPQTVAPSKVNLLYDNRSITPTARPALTVRTAVTRSSGPGATATSTSSLRTTTSLANTGGPGGQKAECSNCGATHTPLWRRGLNDELNCNACGLYCKLHKRPRPKSMRNTHGERAQAPPRQETVDVTGLSSSTPKVPPRSSSPVNRTAQCYNCHTTATPLWRKDDEGKTVCNACGLYYKLHGSARPISMKSDVIRKRSRHDARRGGGGNSVSDTPSASPGVSRRASPAREASPTLAPDSTTQMTYDYSEEIDYRSTHSELLGALGGDTSQNQMFQYTMYPGPYHPDYLTQVYAMPSDPLPFAHSDTASVTSSSEGTGNGNGNTYSGGSASGTASGSGSGNDDPAMSPRSNKRRRMSTDSASEPPSSASYSSFNEGYSSASSTTSLSQHSSMEFPFSSSSFFANGPALRGSGNTFWHPPMMPQGSSSTTTATTTKSSTTTTTAATTANTTATTTSSNSNAKTTDSPHLIHPPMLPIDADSPMDYLHHHGVGVHDGGVSVNDEELFSAFLHPPMAIPDTELSSALGNVHPPMLVDYGHWA